MISAKERLEQLRDGFRQVRRPQQDAKHGQRGEH